MFHTIYSTYSTCVYVYEYMGNMGMYRESYYYYYDVQQMNFMRLKDTCCEIYAQLRGVNRVCGDNVKTITKTKNEK